MYKIHNQKGNALTGALGGLVLFVMVFFCIILLTDRYSSISKEENQKLEVMVNSVRNTPFEKTFKDRINYNLQDGKISKKEFNEIKDFYTAYKTSQITGTDDLFNKTAESSLENQYKADKFSDKFMGFFFAFITFLVVIGSMIFGWKKAHGG